MDIEFDTFKEYCIHQHDVVCNQKYNESHPYSFHLELVYQQAIKFENLIPVDDPYYSVTLAACYGHDLIEDARVTYNDIKNYSGSELLADIIYCCTEEKGRNRKERHNDKYYTELMQNDLAVFVKLCDIIANVKYSLLTNSSMFGKYKSEFPKFAKLVLENHPQYEPMVTYLENLLFKLS
jgi:(p)ppGpp synthase/HD superfamily hydrolase